MIIKLIYAGFLGLFLVFFVSIGIGTFYAEPEYPEYPMELQYTSADSLTEEQVAAEEQYYADTEAYSEAYTTYGRNVSIIAIASAVLLLAVGVIFADKLDVIGEGLLFGGIFTLFYSVASGLYSNEGINQFVLMTIALLIALGLGYWKFVLPGQRKPAK